MSPIRVLVADDDQMFREVLVELILTDPNFEVVGEAADAHDAYRKAIQSQPDVILLDVRMPGGGGPTAAHRIAQAQPRASIVALTGQEDQESVLEMLRSGAMGYLVKGTPSDEVLNAIRAASRGEAILSRQVTAGVIKKLLKLLEGAEDVTRELAAIDRTKSELIQILAHELRTPITVIHGTVEILLKKRDRLTKEQTEEFAASLTRSTTRIERLARNATCAARIGFHGAKTPRRRISVGELIDISLSKIGNMRNRVNTQVDPEDLEESVLATEDLPNALAAVIENALDFTPESDPVLLRLSLKSDVVSIQVMDKGPGIPDETKDRILKSFTQANSTEVRYHEGLGMGLYVANCVTQLHGGNLKVLDRRGGGAIFLLELPR